MSYYEMRIAGLVIIGDEILKGQVRDVNTGFLARRLYELGIKVGRVSIVPDDVPLIASQVKEFSDTFDVVFTAGGIGPTHDDVTYEAAAMAFDDVLKLRPEIVKAVESYCDAEGDSHHAAMKLARVPSKAVLLRENETKWPVVSIRNVYFFPGIPFLLRKAFDSLAPILFCSKEQITSFDVRKVFSSLSEVAIAPILNEFVSKYPHVTFGSYPEWSHPYYRTRLTLECENNLPLLLDTYREALNKIPGSMLDYDDEPFNGDVYEKISHFIQRHSNLKESTEEAFQVLEDCFRRYSPDEIFICFNGGKDSIVMLHLTYAIFKRRFEKDRINALYIRETEPFPEVESFITQVSEKCDLNLITMTGPMKTCVKELLEKIHPTCQSMILGTRRTDPGSSNLLHFSPTDRGWPEMMRVSPILNWNYSQIWNFIRGLSIPYPILYNEGYTSLGGKRNTAKNPALKIDDETYQPAYLLNDGSLERNGRRTC